MSPKKFSVEITKLLDKGARDMASKQYELAVDHYSEACELSNLESGKDDPDLLYLYGWSLFENAVANSDVLGQNAANATLEETKREAEEIERGGEDSEKAGLEGGGMMQFNDKLAEDEGNDEEEEEEEGEEEEKTAENIEQDKTGDEEESNENPPQVEGQQSDFEIAWEILDLTRTILQKEVSDTEKEEDGDGKRDVPYLTSDKESELEDQPPIVLMKKKLADVYSLLGDISLETENFQQAGADLTTMVDLRRQLYPLATGSLTEAYYKLSLATEFTDLPGSIEAMRMVLKSIEERTSKGEKIEKDVIQEMKQRLYDLEKGDRKIKEEKERIMKGILGGIASTTTANSVEGVASETPIPSDDNSSASQLMVNDLTSLVKKRKPESSHGRKGKRGKSSS
ncbi:DEKNAAC100076 [Brettanomyces naardenensis]|uniref:DEKNAAC100076 n=1 Tax=Brettanomyces naardenensis TaxID=13370 RepID=A0A448YFH0_BRENA|nr:DEKNAAC100076 [Brettanomyces naardenensis]